MRNNALLPVIVVGLAVGRWGLAQEPVPTALPSPASSSSTSPASSSLAPIQVRVDGERKQRADRTADTVRVSGDRLRTSPKATLLEALAQDAPDMYVPSRGAGIHGVGSGATGGIHLRGLGGSPSSQVVVIEDGTPDYQGLFGHPIPDAYAPFLLDEAVIVRGGDSVLYGTNAMGGAILLRSRWRQQEGWELENDSAVGSYNTLRQSAAVLGKEGRFGLSGGVLALRTDGHRVGAGGSNLIGQFSVRTRLGAGWEVTLREKAMHLTGADPGPVTHPNDNHFFDVWRERASVQASWHSDAVSLRAQPFFNVGRHELYDGFRSVDTTSGAILESEMRLHPAARLLVGSAVDRADASAENRVTGERMPVRAQQTASWYDQLTVEPVKGLQLIGGTREVVSASYGFVFLYKGGFRWSLGNGWYVRGRASRNFRQPTLSELYLPFPTANPNLKPERSLGTDAGLGYSSRHLELSGAWYRNDVDNLIKYFGVWPAAEVVNIDHTTVVGLEAQVVARDLGPLTVRAGGSWQDVGRYTKQNPSARGVFGVELRHPMGGWTLRSALEGEWVHGLYMSNYSRDRMDDVLVLNLAVRARREQPDRDLVVEPYVALRNLLDSRYAYVKDYTMPGFNALAGLRLVL
ncbi:MAG: TonB-dependent receptor [Deltaproteobacteria bacterium]|nr:TonB-dependent receptor [Deltaproteobacteria bacterium]